MEEKIYKISSSSIYMREQADVALVRGTYNEIQKLIDDMNNIKKGNVKDFYTFKELPIQVFDENGEYFNVLPTRLSSGLNIDEPQVETVKDSKEGLEDKINRINEHSKEVYYEYEKANILTLKQAWLKFENQMKKLHIAVSENSKFSKSENVEREK